MILFHLFSWHIEYTSYRNIFSSWLRVFKYASLTNLSPLTNNTILLDVYIMQVSWKKVLPFLPLVPYSLFHLSYSCAIITQNIVTAIALNSYFLVQLKMGKVKRRNFTLIYFFSNTLSFSPQRTSFNISLGACLRLIRDL